MVLNVGVLNENSLGNFLSCACLDSIMFAILDFFQLFFSTLDECLDFFLHSSCVEKSQLENIISTSTLEKLPG